MRVNIERLEGDRDGIRFGRVRLGGDRVLAFNYDLLSGGVRLFQADNSESIRPRPATAEETDAARAALHAVAPPLAPHPIHPGDRR